MRATSTGKRLGGAIAAATLLANLFLVGSAGIASAAGYDFTDPYYTPCGDGSHTISTLASAWLYNASGKKLAKVELRYSAYCDTVWTRYSNYSGAGSAYAPAQVLTLYGRVWEYDCASVSCPLGYTQAADTLQPYGTFPWQGWTYQRQTHLWASSWAAKNGTSPSASTSVVDVP